MSWFDDRSNKDAREFVEAGGYGEFKGWNQSGFNTASGSIPGRGFDTHPVSNARSLLPPDRSYFAGGKFHTVDGNDRRLIPPGYELIHTDEGYSESFGDGANPEAVPARMILKRIEAPAERDSTPTPAPTPTPTPTPPAPRVDASNPSLADALRDQGQQRGGERPALQDALGSAMHLNGWKEAGYGKDALQGPQEPGDSGRRFAASDRWRRRLDALGSHFG